MKVIGDPATHVLSGVEHSERQEGVNGLLGTVMDTVDTGGPKLVVIGDGFVTQGIAPRRHDHRGGQIRGDRCKQRRDARIARQADIFTEVIVTRKFDRFADQEIVALPKTKTALITCV